MLLLLLLLRSRVGKKPGHWSDSEEEEGAHRTASAHLDSTCCARVFSQYLYCCLRTVINVLMQVLQLLRRLRAEARFSRRRHFCGAQK